MKKTILIALGILMFGSIAFAQQGSVDGNWASRRADYNKNRNDLLMQEIENLVKRQLSPFVSGYYAIEVVMSSQNAGVKVYGTLTIATSSGTASITVFSSSNTSTVMTVPYDYNMYYATWTAISVTGATSALISITSYETNFLSIYTDGASGVGNVYSSFGNGGSLIDGITFKTPVFNYYTSNAQIILNGLSTEATYYAFISGRKQK